MRRIVDLHLVVTTDKSGEECASSEDRLLKFFGRLTEHLFEVFDLAHGTSPGDVERGGGGGAGPEVDSERARDTGPTRVSPADVEMTWRGSPGAHYADGEDTGQHDTWKREALFALWRWVHAPQQGAFPRQAFGLDQGAREHTTLGPVFPVSEQLAEASRRLGFLRLFTAALGISLEGGRTLADYNCSAGSLIPYGLWEQPRVDEAVGDPPTLLHLLQRFHAAAEAAALAEAEAVFARNTENRRQRADLVFDDVETWMLSHTLGSLDNPRLTRPPDGARGEMQEVVIDMATCPPLAPLKLNPHDQLWT